MSIEISVQLCLRTDLLYGHYEVAILKMNHLLGPRM